MSRRLFYLSLFFFIFIRSFILIYEGKDGFFLRGFADKYEFLREAYYHSQYVNKNNPGIIPDEAFESFAGGAFIRGVNPIMIVHEHPPLGRYIIGFSILFFDNPNTLILPLIFFSVLGLFLIAKLILKKTIFALIPLAFFVNEPLFLSKLEHVPLLESIQLTFIIFSLYFFIRGISSPSNKYIGWFVLSSIMLGFVISIRFFILGLFLALSMCLFFILKRKIDQKFIAFILSLPLSLVILVGSYFRTIQDGYSIWQIFGIQKYIFFYHQSKLNSLFSFWDLLLFNRWHTWWGERTILHDSQWLISWPISTLLTGLSVVNLVFRKMKFSEPEVIVVLWVLMYSSLLSIGYSTTRYFLPLIPFLYILATSFLLKLFRLINGIKD